MLGAYRLVDKVGEGGMRHEQRRSRRYWDHPRGQGDSKWR